MMVFKNRVGSLEVSKKVMCHEIGFLCLTPYGSSGACCSKNNDVSEKLLLVSKVNTLNLCPDILVLLILIYRHKYLSFCYVTIASAKQRSLNIGLTILKAAKPRPTIQC